MKPDDVGNDLGNFGILERWAAAHPIPGKEQFQHHLWINLMP